MGSTKLFHLSEMTHVTYLMSNDLSTVFFSYIMSVVFVLFCFNYLAWEDKSGPCYYILTRSRSQDYSPNLVLKYKILPLKT